MVFSPFINLYRRVARWFYSRHTFRTRILPWLSAITLIILGIFGAERLEERHALLDLSYKAYAVNQYVTAKLKGDLWDHNTVVVLIGDEEFWKGDYARRTPINHQELAELIRVLDGFGPKVIALDFDFASPTPDGSIVQHKEYIEETKILANTIHEITTRPDISNRRTVVLPRTLGWDAESFFTEPDVYDEFSSEIARARFGYILLLHDHRRVPLSIRLKDGSRLDSFSEAIVRAFDLTGRALQIDTEDEPIVFGGGFLYEHQFDHYYANDIIEADDNSRAALAQKLGGRIVVIGAGWSRDGYNRGNRVDLLSTPVGTIPAVFMHANWVESMLASRTAKPLGNWPRRLLEFLVGIAAYLFFTRHIWWPAKLLIYAVCILIFWLGIAYLSFQNLNVFLDPVTPSLMAFAKAAYEQIHHWKRDANKWNKEGTWLMWLWLGSASRESK